MLPEVRDYTRVRLDDAPSKRPHYGMVPSVRTSLLCSGPQVQNGRSLTLQIRWKYSSLEV